MRPSFVIFFWFGLAFTAALSVCATNCALVIEATKRIVNLVNNFGGSYASSNLIFGGG